MFDFKDKYTGWGQTAPVPPPASVETGSVVLLKSMEVTSSTSVADFMYSFDGKYDDYVLRVRDLYFTAGNSEYIGMQFFIGGSLITTSNHVYTSSSMNTGTVNGFGSTSATSFFIGHSSFMDNTRAFCADINLVNAGSTTLSKGFFGYGTATNRTTGTAQSNNVLFNGTLPSSTSQLTGLRFFFAQSSSSIIGGRFLLYGVRKSTVKAVAA